MSEQQDNELGAAPSYGGPLRHPTPPGAHREGGRAASAAVIAERVQLAVTLAHGPLMRVGWSIVGRGQAAMLRDDEGRWPGHVPAPRIEVRPGDGGRLTWFWAAPVWMAGQAIGATNRHDLLQQTLLDRLPKLTEFAQRIPAPTSAR